MKSILLTGATGAVAYVLRKELQGEYDVRDLSVVRMDATMAAGGHADWAALREAYREAVLAQFAEAFEGLTCVAHLGWNTRDENYKGGLDPLNILVTDCVYRAAIEASVPRIYQASSVHAHDFYPWMEQDGEPLTPFPDTREDPFGTGATSLYGVSKRWMEIAGQYYVRHLKPGQKILCVRLGAVNRNEKPGRSYSRLWDSHGDCAGLLRAFVECDDDAPAFFTSFGISDNQGDPYPRPLMDPVNPYGFTPQDNAWTWSDDASD